MMTLDIFLNMKRPSTSWFNMGYWRNTTSHKTGNQFVDACEAMANLVATIAGLSQEDVLLDVGCGSGEQDFYFYDNFACKRIVAVDISPQLISLAKEKQLIRQIHDISFLVGSATKLDVCDNFLKVHSELDGPFDKIISMDSAYHYDSRVDFFKQAHKFLKPGGILVIADICLTNSDVIETLRFPATYLLKLMLRAGYIPYENLYTHQEYLQKLGKIGFEQMDVRVITDDVFPGLLKFLNAQKCDLAPIARSHLWSKLDLFAKLLGALVRRKCIEFVVVRAKKPIKQ
jgi:microcystin synthetase protein McyJ